MTLVRQAALPAKPLSTGLHSPHHATRHPGLALAIYRAASDSLHPGRLARLMPSYGISNRGPQNPGQSWFGRPESSGSFMSGSCQARSRLPASCFAQHDPDTVESPATAPMPVTLVLANPSMEASNNHGHQRPKDSSSQGCLCPQMLWNTGSSGARRPCAHCSVACCWGTRCTWMAPPPTLTQPYLTPRNAGT